MEIGEKHLFRITARTVLELGAELISSDIIAFYELIKNGFDARTKNGVEVRFDIALTKRNFLRIHSLIDSGRSLEEVRTELRSSINPTASTTARAAFDKVLTATTVEELAAELVDAQRSFNTITVGDTGSGMSLDDLRTNFLVIGTPSRKKDVDAAIARGASETPYLGEKGIGRLSAMRLGEKLRVETARSSDEHLNLLDIDWNDFADYDAMLDQVPVDPTIGGPKPRSDWSGTAIIIGDLIENWTEARVREMAEYDLDASKNRWFSA